MQVFMQISALECGSDFYESVMAGCIRNRKFSILINRAIYTAYCVSRNPPAIKLIPQKWNFARFRGGFVKEFEEVDNGMLCHSLATLEGE